MSRNEMLIAGMALWLVASAPAIANSADELKEISTETVILNAKAKREEARARLAKSVADQKGVADGRKGAAEPAPGDPTVNWIEGVGRNIAAQLQLADGGRMEVRVGDTLSGTSIKVLSISQGEVVVQRGQGRRVQLSRTPVATAMPYGGAAQFPGGFAGQPGLPPALPTRP